MTPALGKMSLMSATMCLQSQLKTQTFSHDEMILALVFKTQIFLQDRMILALVPRNNAPPTQDPLQRNKMFSEQGKRTNKPQH